MLTDMQSTAATVRKRSTRARPRRLRGRERLWREIRLYLEFEAIVREPVRPERRA
jgi:hypothetical protein